MGARRIVGSAGSVGKVTRLTERLGFDAGIDYRAGSLTEQLAKAAPDGIDVYFDNVGGDHLEAAIDALRDFGRIAWCGAINQYNNLRTLVRLRAPLFTRGDLRRYSVSPAAGRA